MRIFGGDPRFVQLEILFQFNIWYDVIMLLIMFFAQLTHLKIEGMLILVPFIMFEIIRITLHKAHKTGDIPLCVAFLMLTVLPMLVLDILWLVAGRNATGVDSSAMVGFVVLHVLQLAFCTNVYRTFKAYQGGFYQFARGFDRRDDDAELGVDEGAN
jgi:hypothetical protein